MSRVAVNARSELAEIHEAAKRGPTGKPLAEMVRGTIEGTAATRFVRMCVGPGAFGISIEGPCTIRMSDNRFRVRMPFQFQTSGYKTGTW